MTLRVAVFAEDRLGMTLARDLCDRAVVRAAGEHGYTWLVDLWEPPETRVTQRAWTGIDGVEPWTTWESAKNLAHTHRVVTHGHPGLKGYGLEALRAARIAARFDPPPDLVVLCRDTDGSASLRRNALDGLALARVELPVILAVAHPESEAWVVAGFFAANRAEEEIVRKLRSEHGFNPTAEPHRLTAGKRTDPHDAKRACEALFPDGTSSERAQRCWREAPLEDLERRGAETGLPEYLDDVTQAVMKLLGAPAWLRS